MACFRTAKAFLNLRPQLGRACMRCLEHLHILMQVNSKSSMKPASRKIVQAGSAPVPTSAILHNCDTEPMVDLLSLPSSAFGCLLALLEPLDALSLACACKGKCKNRDKTTHAQPHSRRLLSTPCCRYPVKMFLFIVFRPQCRHNG